jgi:hypothetical protein
MVCEVAGQIRIAFEQFTELGAGVRDAAQMGERGYADGEPHPQQYPFGFGRPFEGGFEITVRKSSHPQRSHGPAQI